MTALRTAAQQALEALYQAREFTELYDTEHAAAVNERCHENIAALRAALAQKEEPVQEPEGLDWRYTARIGYVVKPYTAPPQRKLVPLTEEEIDAEWHELDGEASALFKRVIRKFARAVEKTSWEKNHGQA